MQVEVKLVLNGADDYSLVCSSLEKNLITEETHENHFFDSYDTCLLNNRAHLRLRFLNGKSTLSLKEHASYECGAATRWATEIDVDELVARKMISDPSTILKTDNSVVDTLRRHFSLSSLTYLGGFTTNRKLFMWSACKSQPGLVLRLDHTIFPTGHRFEIEIPSITVPVQDVLDEISSSLDSLRIPFSMAHESKLEAFLSGARNALARSHMIQDAKLMLKDRNSFEKLTTHLAPSFIRKEEQVNYFFDGVNKELEAQGAYLRVRKVGGKCTVVLKENQGINDGSSVYWGRQIDLPIVAFDDLIRSPSSLMNTNSPIVQALADKFNISALACTGSFKNTRSFYEWKTSLSSKPLTLQLDHTVFPYGAERFEVEVSDVSVPLSDVIEELSSFLTSFGVDSQLSSGSKFYYFSNNKTVQN